MDVIHFLTLWCFSVLSIFGGLSSADKSESLFRVKRGGHSRCGNFRAVSHGFCKGKYAGLYPHQDKRCYIQCDQWGYAYVRPCPWGTFWAGSYGNYPSKYNKCVSYKYGRHHGYGRGHGIHGHHGHRAHGNHGYGHYGGFYGHY